MPPKKVLQIQNVLEKTGVIALKILLEFQLIFASSKKSSIMNAIDKIMHPANNRTLSILSKEINKFRNFIIIPLNRFPAVAPLRV